MGREPSTADGGAGRRGWALAVLLALLAPMAGAQPMGGGGPSGPTEVGVMELASEQVPYTLTLPGRAVAYEEAGIRPRVNGSIEEVAYRPGQPVEAGELLFRIEDDSYAAAVAAAEATRAGAEAAVATAQATVDRYRSLEGSAVTRAELETAEAALSQAQAQLASAEAGLTSARLDLDRTAIRSPIAGIPSVPAVSTGELVTANQADALATVTRLDPIYVDVTESSARMLRIRERIDQGSLSPGGEIDFRLVLETGAVLEGEGTLVTPGTSVSTTTGTVDIRIAFDNPQGDVLPGQFLRVEVTLGTSEGLLVPQRATSRAPNGDLTAFVAGEGTAREVTLTSTGTYRNAWVVTEGVEPGNLLIVDGLNNLRDGAEITTVPVTIDEQGVVRDLAPETPDGGEAAPETAGAATSGTETRAEASGSAASPAAAPATARE
ncbi:efflux RND transporter periplasmic adaptor subunit [Rubellimicrobium roseum]|uniref:efflux RND transporter periplasmic adaptor subunit n=1 Tax=Rubellimicrobium roseum TaxID=687525 RepID=UPI00159BAD2F|nr:efflux RND transporter periplasmic adaptor subunit [Rubellimicrobium roseum]